MDKIKKENLNQEEIIIAKNTPDGNCFYNVHGHYFHNKEEYNIYYRKQLSQYILTPKN